MLLQIKLHLKNGGIKLSKLKKQEFLIAQNSIKSIKTNLITRSERVVAKMFFNCFCNEELK